MRSGEGDGVFLWPEEAEGIHARGESLTYIAITDHSKGLKIAGGIDEEQLAKQAEEIAAVDEAMRGKADSVYVLRISVGVSKEQRSGNRTTCTPALLKVVKSIQTVTNPSASIDFGEETYCAIGSAGVTSALAVRTRRTFPAGRPHVQSPVTSTPPARF